MSYGIGLCVRWRLKPQMLNLKTKLDMSKEVNLKDETANSTKPVFNDGFKIEVGQIFEIITDDFYASKNIESIANQSFGGRDARFYLKKGERIEIRFPFAWNYRTEDNIYFHSDNDYILSKCKLVGKVEAKVKSNNNATLEEILRLELYDKVEQTIV